MRILITGATGFVGQELTKALSNQGHSLALLVRNSAKAAPLVMLMPDVEIIIIEAHSLNWASCVTDFLPEIVIHLAALLTSRDDLEIIPTLITSNVTFGTELLQALKGAKVKLFINTGTSAEYYYGDGQHNPSYLYAATKTAFHSIISYYQQLGDFKVVNVIPYTVYGLPDTQPKIIDIIYNSFFADKPAAMSGGQQTLDFVHIQDIVTFYCLLVAKEQEVYSEWENYYLGTGQGSTLRQIAQLISAKLGLPENINWGALPYRARDTMYSVAPVAKLLNHFNWKPTIDIESGIDKFLADK